MTTEEVLLRLAGIVLLGVGAQWLAWRFRLPSILLLLVLGFVAGPATGFLDPDELLGDLLIPIVSLGVAVVLFEGGLSLNFDELAQVRGVVRNLISIGAVVTWVIATAAAVLILDLDFSLAVLLGGILMVTGPTVIGPLLEHVRPIGRVGPILKWEGIVIDPLGAILAVLAFEVVLGEELREATTEAALGVLQALAAGTVIGALAAGLIVLLLKRYWLPDSLQIPMTLAAVTAAHTASNSLESESGLLAATVMGIVLANQKAVSIEHIAEFKENLRVLLIGALFILLAARLETDDLTELGLAGFAFLAVLVLVARPAAVALSTLRSALSWRERAYLAWMAPRGIVAASVASIFALRLAEEGEAEAERLVPLTFMVIIGTIAVYGLSAAPVARWLKLARPNPQGVLIAGAHAWARDIARALQAEGFQVLLVDSNRGNVSDARMAGLPALYTSILSERVMDEIEMEGIGRLLALTSNDEVNSLAAQHFDGVFGRAEVYQLTPKAEPASKGDGGGGNEAIPQHLRGRLLFGPDVTYSYLESRFAAGAVLKTTKLSDEFDFEAFVAMYGEGAAPLFLITPGRELLTFCTDKRPTPRADHTLISLIDPLEEDGTKPEQTNSDSEARRE